MSTLCNNHSTNKCQYGSGIILKDAEDMLFSKKKLRSSEIRKEKELVKEISNFTHPRTVSLIHECWTFHKFWGTHLKAKLFQQEREYQRSQADL